MQKGRQPEAVGCLNGLYLVLINMGNQQCGFTHFTNLEECPVFSYLRHLGTQAVFCFENRVVALFSFSDVFTL